jgi:hypothetical protein
LKEAHSDARNFRVRFFVVSRVSSIFPEWIKSEGRGIPLPSLVWFLVFMAKKRMTSAQAESAQRRAVAMFRNFGDETGAQEFEKMTPEKYAEHKGIELVEANPQSSTNWRQRIMAKSKIQEELEDTISDIYDVVQEAGSTRSQQLDALNQVADLCTEAIPGLGEEAEDDGDEEETE